MPNGEERKKSGIGALLVILGGTIGVLSIIEFIRRNGGS